MICVINGEMCSVDEAVCRVDEAVCWWDGWGGAVCMAHMVVRRINAPVRWAVVSYYLSDTEAGASMVLYRFSRNEMF